MRIGRVRVNECNRDFSPIIVVSNHYKRVHNPGLCPMPEENRAKGFLCWADEGTADGDESGGSGIWLSSGEVVVSTSGAEAFRGPPQDSQGVDRSSTVLPSFTNNQNCHQCAPGATKPTDAGSLIPGPLIFTRYLPSGTSSKRTQPFESVIPLLVPLSRSRSVRLTLVLGSPFRFAPKTSTTNAFAASTCRDRDRGGTSCAATKLNPITVANAIPAAVRVLLDISVSTIKHRSRSVWKRLL